MTPAKQAFSSGIAVWDRKEDLAELVRRSDLALYAARAAGGGCTEVAPPILEPLPEITFRRAHNAEREDGEPGERAAAG